MKTPFRLSIVLWFCLSGAANLGCVASVQANELQTNSVTQQVLQAQSFREGLVWIGPKEPSASESQELLGIIRNLSQPEWTGEVEQFLEAHPHSPWAASLHCDYASFCRRTGRTTKALEHFEAAWTLIKNNTSPQAQRLGGAILANWTDLLASLGRSQKLKELIAEGDRWHFVNPQDRNKHEGTKNSYYLMQAHPEIAYRCGTFALKAVAGVLQPTNQDLESLVAVPSPTNGFSMANLLDLSKKYGLDLVAVRRTAGQELIVPSVVHWRQNHYAAILAQQEDLYLVSDPTFGREKWMPSDVINEEASGEFLIPKERLPDGWVLLARAGTLAIHGMGLPNNVNDGKDKFCKRNFDGGAACIPCKNAKGMPVWWVSEPYINLWIADQPLSYLTSRGEPFTFQITYKQRDSQSGWENSWVSTATMTGLTPCGGQSCASLYGNSDITIHLPNGGEVDFPHKSGIWNDMTPRYDSETRLMVQPLLTNFVSETRMDDGSFGLRLMHADGSQDIYLIDYATGLAGDYPQSSGKLVRHIDRNGDTTWFQYDSYGGPDVLTFVVDPDGRTNFLSYNTSSGLLLSVTNAYGQSAHFKYDSSGNLTNIVDAAGLPSSIRYDPNNTPTKLITPYGTNQFLIVDNGSAGTTSGLGNFGGHNVIDRAVQVTDPVGATNLYLYRYDCSSDTPLNMPTSFSSSDVPVGTPIGALDDGSGSTTNALAAVCYRNSFHWGPRQFANLSTANMSNLTSGDYLLARMRHWLEDTNQLFLTGYLSVERDPSPDGTTEGLKTFYDYQGKLPGFNFCAGTNALPSVRTWRLPNGETHYEYLEFDYFGNITSDITTYTESDGTVGTRTNQFIYADNTYAYLWGQTDGNGNWSGQPLTTTYTIPNLLTEVIGADGNPMWTLGGFETVMWTNFFYLAGAGETNRSVLTSCRVLPDYATNGVGEVTTIAYTPNTKPVNYYDLLQGSQYGTLLESAFSGGNKIASLTTPAGLTTTNLYDANGFQVQTIGLQIGRTNSFGYTTDGLIGVWTNELGLKRGITWNNLLQLTGVQYPDGTSTSIDYNRLDPYIVSDRLGNATIYLFDRDRRLGTIWFYPNNTFTTFQWCSCGELTSITDALNQQTAFNYDNQGNLTSVDYPDGSSLNYQYNLAGQAINVFDGAGRTWQLTYNNQGLVINVSNAYGTVRSVVYDIRDRPASVTDANGVTVNYSYDPLNRVLTRTWPNNATEGFGYSTAGLAFYTNQLGKVTKFGYDAAGRVTSETNANNQITRFTYDPAGDLLTLTDGKNQTTTWKYDIFGNVSNKLEAGSLVFAYKYDPDNRLTNRWTPAKGNTGYSFDAVGNLTFIHYPSGPGVTMQYDALNRLTNMVDSLGTTMFGYDPMGHLTNETAPWPNDTVSCTYSQGLRTGLAVSQPAGAWTQSYGYDSARRLRSVSSPAGAFTYTLGGAGPASPLVSQITLPNGSYAANAYDSLARLAGTWLATSGNATLDAALYGYDAANQRIAFTNTAATWYHYTYDPIGQLTVANSSIAWQSFGYAYDAAGNLNYRTNSGGSSVDTFYPNNLNEIPNFQAGGFYHDNSYDANGNLTFFDDGNNGCDGYNLYYDAENQLTEADAYSGCSLEGKVFLQYDGLGRLRVQTLYDYANGITNQTLYLYDGMQVVQERDGYNNPTVSYTRGNDLSRSLGGAGGIGGLLARSDEYAGGSWGRHDFYHSDGGGNITYLETSSQGLGASYSYDAYGNLLSASGASANANGYASKGWVQLDPVGVQPMEGVYAYGHRLYAPYLQRWLTRDLLGEPGFELMRRASPFEGASPWPAEVLQGPNLYTFVANNPVNYVDPYGLWWGQGAFNSFGDAELNALQSAKEFFTGKPGDMTPNDGYNGDRAGTGTVTPLPDENGNPTDIADVMLDLGTIPLMAAAMGPEREGADLLAGAVKCKKAANITFKTGHVAQHLKDLGLAADKVEPVIADSIKAATQGASQTGEFMGRVTVDGKVVEYRAFTLPDGTINVGTYYPPTR